MARETVKTVTCDLCNESPAAGVNVAVLGGIRVAVDNRRGPRIKRNDLCEPCTNRLIKGLEAWFAGVKDGSITLPEMDAPVAETEAADEVQQDTPAESYADPIATIPISEPTPAPAADPEPVHEAPSRRRRG